MNNLEKHLLKFEITYNYVINHLDDGKILSQVILKNCNFKLGNFYTILPKNANLDALYHFEIGGIIPQEKEIQLIDFIGSTAKYQELTSTEDSAIEYVYNYIKNKKGIVILEDVVREKKDNLVKINDVCTSYLNEEVYYILKAPNSYEEIAKAFKKASHVWHFVGMLTTNHIDLTEEITLEQIRQLTLSMQSMIVVAYDGESYIFWEKQEKDLS